MGPIVAGGLLGSRGGRCKQTVRYWPKTGAGMVMMWLLIEILPAAVLPSLCLVDLTRVVSPS